ncbi:hypothetical protein HaLaN_01591 [Haematococcus lacustris]|uniref:Uncharacterized protein n=1 Tax=Haematococcus lacustris TaxID=44745 RepID=A0A699YIP9_HAELA|nr:hypothetical protein HaLaN_01591 [Haematococcus lacustris]
MPPLYTLPCTPPGTWPPIVHPPLPAPGADCRTHPQPVGGWGYSIGGRRLMCHVHWVYSTQPINTVDHDQDQALSLPLPVLSTWSHHAADGKHSCGLKAD